MVAFDAPFLPLLFGHEAKAPTDPQGNAIDDLPERIELLIETLEDEKETLLLPQPAFSEFLVIADRDGPKYIERVERSPFYKFGDFDLKASVELAAIRREGLRKMSKRQLKRQTPAETAAKISFDRQIVAIAKANGAHTIYSNDAGVKRFAEQLGIRVVAMWELPFPTPESQMTFDEVVRPATDNVEGIQHGEQTKV